MHRFLRFFFLLFACLFLHHMAWAHKPYNELEISHADLETYPKKINRFDPGIEVTIGDLHGNALKLMYFLISNNVVSMTKENYKKWVDLYKKAPKKLKAIDIASFNTLINESSINPQQQIRFLGDDLCDRGMNDYYTLSIFKKLDNAGVAFDIILSNHGNFFLTAYEKPEHSFSLNPYGEGENESLVQSMLNMGKIIEKGLVNQQEVLDMVQHHYLKHIKLPGYTVNKKKNEITLYSHAPIDLKIFAALAADLKTPFYENNVTELSQSLDAINAQINQWIMTNTFSVHYNELNEEHKKAATLSPIHQVLWNRDYALLDRDHSPEKKSYSINYVHGHDSMPNVFDLDNLFGKGSAHNKGSYAIHLTHS